MDSVEIYYFSGTGNSLFVAKDVARELNGELIPIDSLTHKKTIQPKAQIIGIIFPVYFAELGGIPNIVEDFIKKLDQIQEKYIFAICTHHGLPGMTITNLKKQIANQSGSLNAGFTVNLHISYSLKLKLKKAFLHKDFDIFDTNLKNLDQVPNKINQWNLKLKEIVSYVKANKSGKYETQGFIKRTLLAPHSLFMRLSYKARYSNLAESKMPFEELVKNADKSFQTNDSCTGCGICVKVCPVNNIVLIEEKPVWKHQCANCLSCFTFCPNNSIHGEIVSYEIKYHLPQIKLKDMIRRKNKAQTN